MVIQGWVSASMFLKMNEVSILFQGKQLTVFGANDKTVSSKN